MKLFELGSKPLAQKIIPPAILLIILAAAIVLPQMRLVSILTGASMLMYIVLSSAWNIFSGPTGYVSLATSAFFGLGVYMSAFFSNVLPLWVLMLLGAAAAFVLAVIVGAITLRLRGVYFTIFTFGLVELLRNVILWFELRNTGRRGRFVAGASVETVYYHLLVLLVILLVVAFIIKKSRFGKALVSIGESEDAAEHVGISTTLVKLTAFAIGSAFVGAVGAAMATRWTYIDPTIAFDILLSFLPVLMVILGGNRTIAGPVIGAAVFVYLQEILRATHYYKIFIGAIMIVAILFLREGIVGLLLQALSNIRAKLKGGASNANP